jgi:hypothetical protein
MNRMCDTGRTICPHKPQCIWHCHFTASELPEPNPRPVGSGGTRNTTHRLVEEAEPVPETWQVIGSIAVGFVLFGVAVVVAIIFATGAWVWSLLI